MRAFFCDVCSNPVFSENVRCMSCGYSLGFLPDVLEMSALEPCGGNLRALAARAFRKVYRSCINGRDYGVCNWMLPMEDPADRCPACRLNTIIPDLTEPGNIGRWQRLEMAKRRVVYTLLKLGAPLDGGPEPDSPPLRFAFLGPTRDGEAPITGHANGVVTINITEADDAEREKRRVEMNESFRTLVGHIRHEVAHYYWDRLIRDSARHDDFRQLFGDENADYAAALDRHHRDGAPADWAERFVTAYASVHPWEDWAETTAHYLHVIDSIETAASFGLSLQPGEMESRAMRADAARAVESGDFDEMLAHWVPLTTALNELNRGTGLPDIYPFVISPPVRMKLRFVHDTFVPAASVAAR
jgi:hypothetical protein